jgi:hypothetical protein
MFTPYPLIYGDNASFAKLSDPVGDCFYLRLSSSGVGHHLVAHSAALVAPTDGTRETVGVLREVCLTGAGTCGTVDVARRIAPT